MSSNHVPLFSVLLVLLVARLCSVASAQCLRFRGQYRDCTCGVKYRDEEERCCNSHTCLEPELSSQNLSCPFVCQNGGVFDDQLRSCSCQPGFFGLCCELGERTTAARRLAGSD